MEQYKISVVVPIYNGGEKTGYIARISDSVLSQDYQNLELLLVDDGSKDDSLTFCNAIVEKDSRVKVFSKPNGGEASARNYGIAQATGDYLHVVDQDDEVIPGMYSDLMQYANLYPDIIKSGYETVYSSGKQETVDAHPSRQLLGRDYIVANIIPYTIETIYYPSKKFSGHWSMLVNLDLIRNNRLAYDEKLPKMNDSKFIVDVLSKAKSIVYIDKSYYRWIKRKGSLTSHYSDMFTGIRDCANYYERLFSSAEFSYDFYSKDKIEHNIKYTMDAMELALTSIKNVNSFKEIKKILLDHTCQEWFSHLEPYDALTKKLKKSLKKGRINIAVLQFIYMYIYEKCKKKF